MSNLTTRFLAVVMLIASVNLATPASAQTGAFTGRIEVTAIDQSGAVLPGVSVMLSGPTSQQAVTDLLGQARFLNLPPGIYTIVARLPGFADYRNQSVLVVSGQNVDLRVRLNVAGQEETVLVVGDSPVVDVKKLTTSTNVTLDELQNIPTARDPWVVMQTVPGIVVDRVNVGGSESGQQSNYIAKGATDDENSWSLDGIPITDMAATGSSPTYYDFDMFQEMQVTTGGADVANATPGVALNMILKSGTNTPRGSARYFYENEGLQSTNLDPDQSGVCAGRPDCEGNRTDKYYDTGFELGGPLIRDRWWAWGAYGKTDVRILVLGGTPDETIMENVSFKTTGQIGQNIRPSFTFFRGNKEKFGRGASPTRPPETTFDQKGPTNFYKGEVNFVIKNNIFMVGRYAYTSGGFELQPQGGLDADWWIDEGGVYHGTVYNYLSDRPQHAAVVEGNWFKDVHEVKFGYMWRKTPVESQSNIPGWGGYYEFIDETTRDAYAWFLRWIYSDYVGEYHSFWVGDTISKNRWTVNASLRFDYSASSLRETTVPGNVSLPDLLPALDSPAVDKAVSWKNLSPRLGVSYALTEDRNTVAKGSYAMFAGQLSAAAATQISPITYSAVYYYAVDANGNNRYDPGEVDFESGLIGYYGFDISNPSALESVNRIDPDVSAPRTHEFVVSLDHQLVPNLAVSGSFTYRYFQNQTWYPLIGVRASDYLPAEDYTGTAEVVGDFSTPLWWLPFWKAPPGGGSEYTNRDGYHQRYWGLEFSATKRLSNRWMARIAFSTNDHREYFDDPSKSIQDPTPTIGKPLGQVGAYGPNVDGGVVDQRSAGSGKSNIFLVLPRYQFVANGLYQGPWGINFAANWVMRQGYNKPYYRSRVPTEDGAVPLKDVYIVDEVDQYRLPTLQTVDIRVEKLFNVDRFNFIVDFDVFNLFNWNTELQRQYDLRRTGATGYNQVLEVLQPRIARIGVRFNF